MSRKLGKSLDRDVKLITETKHLYQDFSPAFLLMYRLYNVTTDFFKQIQEHLYKLKLECFTHSFQISVLETKHIL